MLSKFIKIFLSAIIILLVIFVTWKNLISLFVITANEKTSVFSIVRDQFCIQRIQAPSFDKNQKLVVLRLDDVQAFSWRDISMKIIQDSYRYNAPIVAWVIPKWIYSDPELIRFLKRESCNMEIALHGWDHFGIKTTIEPFRYITEFWDAEYLDARNRVSMWKEYLQPLTNNKKIVSFIPPFNIISDEALRGVYDEWIKITSALWDWIYDYHSSTYNFDEKRIVQVNEILSNCDDAFVTFWLCVIMIHPQDYARPDKTLDTDLYNEYYIEMLDSLVKRNVVFVTFSDILK